MKKLLLGSFLTMVLMSLVSCDTGTGTQNDSQSVVKSSNEYVQRIYEELSELQLASSRAVIGMGGIPTNYRSARVDKFINGVTGSPGYETLEWRDWSQVSEGDIVLDSTGLNGDGWMLWIFITIQGGDHYVVYANNDNADRLAIGVTDYEGQEGQVWFIRWN